MRQRDAPETVGDAVARAGEHARRAAAELTRAASALLDAFALAASERPARRDPIFAPLAGLLADLERLLAPDDGGEDLIAQVVSALGEEIERWEERAGEDAEARAVLRMLLGLRELLWEAGVRGPQRPTRRRPAQPERPAARRARASHA